MIWQSAMYPYGSVTWQLIGIALETPIFMKCHLYYAPSRMGG